MIKKSSLVSEQQRFIDLMQQNPYGEITFPVLRGRPDFRTAFRIVREYKFGADNRPRPEANLADFSLKHQTLELFEILRGLPDGHLVTIRVMGGQPFSLKTVAPQHPMPPSSEDNA
jgi:hypothetical protein